MRFCAAILHIKNPAFAFATGGILLVSALFAAANFMED
jgi:hypothetical protein